MVSELELESEGEKTKFLHPSSKLVKTVIEYIGERQDKKAEQESKQFMAEINHLKNRRVCVHESEPLSTLLEGIKELIKVEVLEGSQSIHLPPATLRK